MNTITKAAVLFVLGLTASAAGAVTIYECVDEEGNRTYQQSCPPGTTVASEKKMHTGSRAGGSVDIESLKETHPISFYTTDNCEACDVMRVYMVARDVPFTTKHVADNEELQEELIMLTGELSVPVITIGESMVRGYNMAELRNKLDSAGYPDKTN